MEVALTVRTRANCHGALVGAVLVLGNRIVSTGFNGTAAGFPNCRDGGCERCRQRELYDRGELEHVTDPDIASGPKQLDLCLCVHAEANALLSAAKFGHRTDGGTLYTTAQPCFACLKESYQAGVQRIVYLEPYLATESPVLQAQYRELTEHLSDNNPRNFEQLVRQRKAVEGSEVNVRDPDLDARLDEVDATAARMATKKAAAAKAAARKATKRPAASKKRSATPSRRVVLDFVRGDSRGSSSVRRFASTGRSQPSELLRKACLGAACELKVWAWELQ